MKSIYKTIADYISKKLKIRKIDKEIKQCFKSIERAPELENALTRRIALLIKERDQLVKKQ